MRKYFCIVGCFILLTFQNNYVFGLKQTHIQSPEEYVTSESPAVFLAGSAAFPWRECFKKNISPEEAVLLDPLNEDLTQNDPVRRIQWEADHINHADILLVWLPESDKTNHYTYSLTSLFETGRFVQMKEKPLLVGIAPGYIRRDELFTQLKVLRPEVVVVDSLEALEDQLRTFSLSYVH